MANIVTTIYRKWSHTTPNYLTLARLIAGLWGLNVFYWAGFEPWLMLALCLVSGFFDALDGWWARTFKEESVAGKLLDPISDKVLGWNAVVIFGHYFLTQDDAVLMWIAIPCVLPLFLNALYDYTVLKMRESDEGMKTSNIAKKKQIYLFVSFGLFLFSLAFKDTSGWSEYTGERQILYMTSVLFAVGGTCFQLMSVPLLAKSARNYFAHTHDERTKRWGQKTFVRFLLNTF